MSVTAVLAVYACGGAALAFWLIVRFPSLGPSRVTGALVLALASLAALSLAESAIEPVAGSNRYGVAMALMLVVLPALTGAFWAAGCMLRVLAGLRNR